MLLEETTTVDAAETFDSVEVAVLPVGSTEQHGPSLPLCTDFVAAETVARGVAHRDDVAVLPTIPVGVSPHHRQFHGTVWVSSETFDRFVTETLESFAGHGVRKAIVVNGHGGNVNTIERVARRLYRDRSVFTVPWSWWHGVGDVPYEVMGEGVEVPGHAGGFEAAMMLHAAESLVRTDRFEAAATGQGNGSRFDDPFVRGFDFADWTENGVKGDPRLATKEAGEALCEVAQDSLDRIVSWLADVPPEELEPRPHK